MGGTFDPIHLGHLIAASEVMSTMRLERVIFLPAGDPWQKTTMTPGEDRFLMTTLAVADRPGFTASRVEIDRKGPTYTADTLEVLAGFYGSDVRLFLILGADALLNLGTWKKLDRLRELADVAVVTRPGWDIERLAHEEGWPQVHHVTMPDVDISGSDIRARVREGRPIDFLVPADVAAYIRKRGLYLDAPTERTA